jgi:hypothetical protein
MFINAVTKVLFGPKNLDGSWPVGVSMVGPAGERGLTGLTGAQGPGGASGGSGATGAKGDTGATGSGGTSAPIASGTNCIGVKCTYKIGDIGPGGGLIFFVDYNDQYADFNYLEAAPTDGVFASSAATGPWATSVTNCGPSSNSSCLTYSIYTQLGVDLATIKGLHRGIFGGQAATAAIIAKHSGVDVDLYAAGVADAYSTATKSDYYLATKDEIELMQKNLNNAGVGEFKANWYWSSSEQGNAYAYVHYPGSGEQTYGTKSPKYYVRPIRSF